MNVDSRKVSSNIFWRLLERFGAQGVTFVVSVILARLLGPNVYGTIAIVMVFISILNVFVNSGFGSALIQKKDADDLDYSSVFYFNIVSSVVLYILLFFCAPLIANFYNNQQLTSLIRVTSILILIAGVKNVQQAYVSKNLMFKKFFFATLGGTIGAAIIGVGCAFLGFGPWALVIQMLFNNLVDTLILWITVKWRPKWMFSFKRLKVLFSFGWKLLISGILSELETKIRQLLIGKMYTTEDLAFFNKGQNFPDTFVTNINNSIDSVLFPSMSSVQDDKERLRNMVRRSIKTSTYIIMPLMMGLAVCANPLINIILSEQWLPCVPYMRIFCFTYAFYTIHTSNLNAIKALGRSDIFLILDIIKKSISILSIVICMWFGVFAIACGMLVSSVLAQIINAWPNKKLLNYSYLSQLKDILPSLLLTLFMGGSVYCVSLINMNIYITLIIQVVLGIVLYIGGSILFKNDNFYYLVSILKKYKSNFSKRAKK